MLMPSGSLIQNITLYCSAKLQNNQVLVAKKFDDTNILKLLFNFFTCYYYYMNQTSITPVGKKISLQHITLISCLIEAKVLRQLKFHV